jgi:hypothetical protein
VTLCSKLIRSGSLGLMIPLHFFISSTLSAAVLNGSDDPMSFSVIGESGSSIPGPYIALRENFLSDSSEVMVPGSVGPQTRINYKPILFSALLPGSGQLYQGQRRGYLYLAAEVASIAGWVVFRNKGGDTKEEYISFAWDFARDGISSRNVRGDDEYYEHIARYQKSGDFSRDPNYDINDPTTIKPNTEDWDDNCQSCFNVKQWDIARITYFQQDSTGEYTVGTPADSLAALQYYAGRAYQSIYYWDWTKGGLETNSGALQHQYLDLRDESNLAYQRATVSLVVLMANHAISVVDAFISSKIELPGGDGENRTKLDMKFNGGLKGFPGGTVRLTHEF